MQFGAGPQLAAQCEHVGVPDGWRAWTDADGPVPDALYKRAAAIASDPNVPLGVTESYPLPGVVTLIRVEPSIWTRDTQGNVVEGCFRIARVYLPSATPGGAGIAAPEGASLAKTVGVLTAASLALGIAASLAAWTR